MRICFLTQTATELSDYYKAFFKGQDLYFVTFKAENPQALAFVPKSTWSDGRNKLWELVKDKYDYYVFIDDDLRFFELKFKSPFKAFVFYLLKLKKLKYCYKAATPDNFFNRLKQCLQKYQPEVVAVTKVDGDPNNDLNAILMKKKSFVRRLGYFDAQFTVFSNYAASKILPYDTKISGWWSAQIPVYMYAFHVFGKKAINIIDLGVANSFSTGGNYVANYDGYNDCKIMLNLISKATEKNYNKTAGPQANGTPVNDTYGRDQIIRTLINASDVEDYRKNYKDSLDGLENVLHSNLIP